MSPYKQLFLRLTFVFASTLKISVFVEVEGSEIAELERRAALPLKPQVQCSSLILGLRPDEIPVSVNGWLPEIPKEVSMRRNLSDSFQTASVARRRLGFDAVIAGEKIYRRARATAGLNALPTYAVGPVENRSHPYWDIGVQAYVVSAWMTDREKIEATAAAMAYLLHDIDDIADQKLPKLLSEMPFSEFSKPLLSFLEDHYPVGYPELYQNVMKVVESRIPGFDRVAFDRATLRMIRGAVLLSDEILRSKRENFQMANKQEHLEMLGDYPDIERFLREEVSMVYYSYTVKSLPDGIFAFYEGKSGKPFSKGLMVLFGIITAPGLVLENIVKEKATKEFSLEALVTLEEVIRTSHAAGGVLRTGISKNRFDCSELIAFQRALVAYGEAFSRVMEQAKLKEAFEVVLHELESGLASCPQNLR